MAFSSKTNYQKNTVYQLLQNNQEKGRVEEVHWHGNAINPSILLNEGN